jgi:hypothetical protein
MGRKSTEKGFWELHFVVLLDIQLHERMTEDIIL